MTRILIACVGQRDLQRRNAEGGLEPLSKQHLREESERIFNDLDNWKNELEFPMILAALRTVVKDASRGDDALQVFLLASDQEDEKHRSGDTIFCAKIIRQLLTEKVRKELKVPPPQVKIIPLRKQPNRHDQMWEEIENLIKRKGVQDHAAQVYVLLSGGTPAQNMGLLLAAIQQFGNRTQVLTVDERTDIATPLRVGQKLMRVFEDKELDAALDNWDFPAARSVLPDGSLEAAGADAAIARLNLDFTQCRDTLEKLQTRVINKVPEHWDRLLNEVRELDTTDVSHNSWGIRMREVYWNAWIKWQRKEYADFLGRLWRLQEAALQAMTSWVVGFDLYEKNNAEPKLLEWIDGTHECKAYLCREKPDLNVQFNTLVMQLVCEWAQEESKFPPDKEEFASKILNAIRSLEALRQLRNNCILAHGLRPVTREEVYHAVQPEGSVPEQFDNYLFQWAADLLSAWDIDPGNNPYELFREVIRELRTIG